MKDNKKLHLTCSCASHELHFEREADDFSFPLWYISFWIRGYPQSPTWKYRLRCIWQILKRGEPYGDEVVLERKDLQELKEYVDNQLELTK